MVKRDKELEKANKKLEEEFSSDYEYGGYYTDWFIYSWLDDKFKHDVTISIGRVLTEEGRQRYMRIQNEIGKQNPPPKTKEVKGYNLILTFHKYKNGKAEGIIRYPIYLTERLYKEIIEFLPKFNPKILERKMVVTGEMKFRDGEWKQTYYHDR